MTDRSCLKRALSAAAFAAIIVLPISAALPQTPLYQDPSLLPDPPRGPSGATTPDLSGPLRGGPPDLSGPLGGPQSNKLGGSQSNQLGGSQPNQLGGSQPDRLGGSQPSQQDKYDRLAKYAAALVLEVKGRRYQIGPVSVARRPEMGYTEVGGPIRGLAEPGMHLIAYRDFGSAAAAQTYVSDRGTHSFMADAPSDVARPFVVKPDTFHMQDSQRFSSPFYCTSIQSPSAALVLIACAYHPPGSSIVAVASTERSAKSAEVTDDDQLAVASFDAVAAEGLMRFLAEVR
jgi:hypothetical protein